MKRTEFEANAALAARADALKAKARAQRPAPVAPLTACERARAAVVATLRAALGR
jgi:hypothetical protein